MSSPISSPSVPPSNQKNKAVAALVAGVVLLVALVGIQNSPAPFPVESAVPQIDPNMMPLVTGEEPIQELFVRAGCTVCHQIPGIAGANGKVGPPLWLGKTGPGRLADPQYRGQAQTVREYIVESIVSPGTYVVPGFPPDTMPTWYGRKLSAGALSKIASYLEQAMEESPSEPR
ncbi:MAG TPA: c-type cytochrome [Nitrospira sp.]|nr:c-type cytochrome [Nitrospira sp.]